MKFLKWPDSQEIFLGKGQENGKTKFNLSKFGGKKCKFIYNYEIALNSEDLQGFFFDNLAALSCLINDVHEANYTISEQDFGK